MISVYCWHSDSRHGHWMDPAAFRDQVDELRSKAEVVWVDLSNPTPEEEELVFRRFFPIHLLSLEDVTRIRREPESAYAPHFPKVEEFADYLFVIVNPLSEHMVGRLHRRPTTALRLDGRATTQLSAVLTNQVLVTHHYDAVPSVEELRSFLSRHATAAERGPDYLFHLILDAMVDHYAPVLDHFDNTLETFERRVFHRPTQQMLSRLLKVKRAITSLRKTLIYEREVLARLCRGEFKLIDVREMAYYRNVYDHLVRFTELIESSRETVSDLMQTHLAAMSNRLSEVMKVLAVISTVILPMNLVAGIYGMNFENMPEIHWAWGYPLALATMTAAGLGALLFFRWKEWI